MSLLFPLGGFGSFIYISLLLVNAIAILSEDRFLSRIGWGTQQEVAFGGGEPSIKAKLINLINAVRTLMRIPLIGLNIIVILYELVLGG